MLIRLNSVSLLKFSGPDAKKFMQGQFTYNLDKISATHANLSAYCNAKGRVIAIFTIFFYQDDYYILLRRDMTEIFLKKIKRYAMLSKVNIEDITSVTDIYDSDMVQNNCLNITLQLNPKRSLLIDFNKFVREESNDETENSWLNHYIDAGIPSITPETTEKFLCHPLNLVELNAVSFDKGCYVGQEIIARTQYRGSVKKHLQLGTITAETTPKPGESLLLENRPVADIVNVAQIESNKYKLLIILKDELLGNSNLYLQDNPKTCFQFLEMPYTIEIGTKFRA